MPTKEELQNPLIRQHFLAWLEGENGAMYCAYCPPDQAEALGELERFARSL